MNVEELREYCLSKKGTTESLPFDEHTLVFKVMNKMFALIPLEKPLQIALKCDPAKAIELRERYTTIEGAYHMNKKHWNTVYIDESIEDALIHQWIDESYNLIVSKLTKKQKEVLKNLPV